MTLQWNREENDRLVRNRLILPVVISHNVLLSLIGILFSGLFVAPKITIEYMASKKMIVNVLKEVSSSVQLFETSYHKKVPHQSFPPVKNS